MEHSRTTSHTKTNIKLIWPVLIAFPLLLAIVWGPHLSAEVYALLRFARGMAEGAGMAFDAAGEFPVPVLDSPLFAFVVSVPARMGVEPSWAVLFLSAAGWIVAAFAVLAIGKSMGRLDGAMVAALLLSFNPAIITTLGSPASWIVASGWLTVALIVGRYYMSAAFALLLFAALHVPWPLFGDWLHINFYSTAVIWSLLLVAASLGADWLAEQLVKRDLVRLTVAQVKTALLVAVFILIGSWQGIRVWQLFQDRSEMIWQLEEETAAWLRTETAATATLLANERIGYLAQRPIATLPDLQPLEMAAAVQKLLQDQPADYLVTPNALPWRQLQELVWFRLAYEPVKQFNNTYLPLAPFTVWSYRQPVSELGQRQPINARVPDRLWILGYQIGPQQVQAGESVQMALIIEAPEATFEKPTAFQAIVRLISPINNSTVDEWIVDLPQSTSPGNWQSKEVIVEQFSLKMPDQLEAGAYQLNLSLLGPESENLWPFSLDNDINRLDRIPTGYVIVPTEERLEDMQPFEAAFGSAIHLAGYSVSEDDTGENLNVSLVWTAEQAINVDYVVFVHLVDSSGELMANHDGIPGNGRFPTRAWQPGVTIPDTHTILLPPELAAGEYKLKVGLYDPDSGQRLAVTAADGTSPEDNSILLTAINWP